METWKDVGIEYPDGVIQKKVIKGIEPKSQTTIVFHGAFKYTRKNAHVLRSMIDAMRIKFREKLREELGGTYGVSVSQSAERVPDEEYSITVSFGSDPGRVDELTDVLFKEIEDVKISGITEKYLVKVKETQRRSLETSMKENSVWLSSLANRYRFGENPSDILTYGKLIDNLSADMIQEAARKYFDMNNYVKVSLFPEEQEQ